MQRKTTSLDDLTQKYIDSRKVFQQKVAQLQQLGAEMMPRGTQKADVQQFLETPVSQPDDFDLSMLYDAPAAKQAPSSSSQSRCPLRP